jgi:hypothetical protein
MAGPSSGQRAKRRADQAFLVTYHQARLAELLEHVREGFAEYDASRIDAFGLDDLVHRYTRAARELWKFSTVSGVQVEQAVRALEYAQERRESVDWWKAAERPDR